eukprot:GEMP01000310.1.p1 GENE.GEMP01000310.1~~GEMP01000310.1.p1  ORF type:complete len:1691 (+),score=330.69 GEMP01000310.1:326-5398(+)
MARIGQAEKRAALDMAFGEAPESMESINMFCSKTQQDAVFSIILSANNLKHLEIRGNGLNADFGWKLIKAMKNSYLSLRTMNGMNVGALKDNKLRHLNLVGFKSGNGIFGIEVCGAIFLAHFLMINRSLESLKFQNNNVEREGAKALSQAILTNAGSTIRSVNHMGQRLNTEKGIDFTQFRQSNIRSIDLSYCNVTDEDLIFLIEWLEKYDCVQHLDLSHNMIRDEGIYKLQRYLGTTKRLRSFNIAMAPLDTGHIAMFTKALHENKTLEAVNFHIGRACGVESDKQQVLHDLAMVITHHPTIREYGESPVRVDKIKGNQLANHDPFAQRRVTKYRNDIAMSLWFIAMCKPTSFTNLIYNTNRRPDGGYPDVVDFVPFYWPPISSICLQMKDTLQIVDLGIPEGMRDVVSVMKYLAGSATLQKFYLRGYAGAHFTNVPAEWADNGRLPQYLIGLLGKRTMHWQALNSFISSTPNLAIFNNVPVGSYKADSAERAMLLLLETVLDASVILTKGNQTQLNILLGPRADLPFVLNATRVVDRAPYRLNINYSPDLVYKRDRVVAQRNDWKQMAFQQHDLATFLMQAGTGKDDMPVFVHHVRLGHPFVIPVLVESLQVSSNLREFTIDAIEKVLPNLVKGLHTGGKNVKLERIELKRYWHTRRRALKKFHELGAPSVSGVKKEAYSEHDLLRALQGLLTNLSEFQGIVTPSGKWDKSNMAKCSLEEFGQKMSGVLVQYPPVAGVYSPNVMVEFVFDPKYSKFPPRGYRRLGMMLPLAPAHRNIRYLNLSNCMIKQEIRNTARSDEFADSSRPLWEGKMVNYRPHLFGPFEDKPMDYSTYKRFHWHPDIRLGSSSSEKFLKGQGFVVEKDLLRLIIVTLLKSPALVTLDMRGNGFDKEDVMIVINQLENNKYLKTLNGIPVVAQEASKVSKLEFDGTGVPVITHQMRETNSEDKAYGQDTCKFATVEMDEGDGFLFASLVTPSNFSKLRHLSITKHRIPDSALTYLCDAIAALPNLDSLDLQRIYVSNRGANMLLSVICQRAQSLKSLNGLPVNLLKQETGGKSGSYVTTGNPILWNEYTMGAASRLKLWSALRLSDEGQVMEVDNRGMTDVGLRGIAGKFKFDSMTADSIGSVRTASIVKLDLSDNKQITDAAMADLCRNLLQPTNSPSLVYLDTRYCPKLRARTAFELYYLLHPKSRPTKTLGTQKLQVVNGMDIKLLHESVRDGKPAPPFVVRLYAGSRKGSPSISESDAHFFAHVLHMFPNVSHCHVHVEITRFKKVHAWQGDTQAGEVDMDSPFRPPMEDPVDEVQKQIDSSKKFFESCPVSTRTQFSCIPRIPVRMPPTSLKGDVIVPMVSGARATAEAGGHFGQMIAWLMKKKEIRQRHLGMKVPPKKKPYYVNNINAQRMHNCFRTLYGVDDVELFHDDVYNPRNRKHRVTLKKVDFSPLFSICSSIDIQHLWFSPIDHLDQLGKSAGSLTIGLLTHLNFQYSNFGDPGLRQLCSLLVDSSAHVIHLGLAYNNISDAGVRHLCSALPHLAKISSLDLSHNFIAESGGIALADTLGGYELTKKETGWGEEDIKLLSLDMEGNKIRDKGAMRFAEFITTNKYLQFLNLKDNEIGFVHDEAIAALVYCVTDNSILSVLDVRENFRKKRAGRYEKTRPPQGLMQGLFQEVSVTDFDENEVYQGVFIRRKRG